MTVASFSRYEQLGKMAHSSDALGVDASALPCDAYVVFFSHRWLSPSMINGHPDDTEQTKHKMVTICIVQYYI
jgi:hypothetical protein